MCFYAHIGLCEAITIEDSGEEQNTSLAEFQNRKKSKRKRKKRKISDFSPLATSNNDVEVVLCENDSETKNSDTCSAANADLKRWLRVDANDLQAKPALRAAALS